MSTILQQKDYKILCINFINLYINHNIFIYKLYNLESPLCTQLPYIISVGKLVILWTESSGEIT